MPKISGIPQVKTRVPLTLWCVAFVVTFVSLSMSLTNRSSGKAAAQQHANMESSAAGSFFPL